MWGLVIGFSLVFGQLAAQEAAVPAEIVRSEYAITFPPGWEVGSGWADDDVYGLAPARKQADAFRENVNIVVDEEVGNLTLEEYYNISLNGLRMLATDFALDRSGETDIGGHKAKFLVFTHRAGVYDLKVLQYVILAKGKAYLITATATTEEFDQYESAFKNIAGSFRIS